MGTIQRSSGMGTIQLLLFVVTSCMGWSLPAASSSATPTATHYPLRHPTTVPAQVSCSLLVQKWKTQKMKPRRMSPGHRWQENYARLPRQLQEVRDVQHKSSVLSAGEARHLDRQEEVFRSASLTPASHSARYPATLSFVVDKSVYPSANAYTSQASSLPSFSSYSWSLSSTLSWPQYSSYSSHYPSSSSRLSRDRVARSSSSVLHPSSLSYSVSPGDMSFKVRPSWLQVILDNSSSGAARRSPPTEAPLQDALIPSSNTMAIKLPSLPLSGDHVLPPASPLSLESEGLLFLSEDATSASIPKSSRPINVSVPHPFLLSYTPASLNFISPQFPNSSFSSDVTNLFSIFAISSPIQRSQNEADEHQKSSSSETEGKTYPENTLAILSHHPSTGANSNHTIGGKTEELGRDLLDGRDKHSPSVISDADEPLTWRNLDVALDGTSPKTRHKAAYDVLSETGWNRFIAKYSNPVATDVTSVAILGEATERNFLGNASDTRNEMTLTSRFFPSLDSVANVTLQRNPSMTGDVNVTLRHNLPVDGDVNVTSRHNLPMDGDVNVTSWHNLSTDGDVNIASLHNPVMDRDVDIITQPNPPMDVNITSQRNSSLDGDVNVTSQYSPNTEQAVTGMRSDSSSEQNVITLSKVEAIQSKPMEVNSSQPLEQESSRQTLQKPESTENDQEEQATPAEDPGSGVNIGVSTTEDLDSDADYYQTKESRFDVDIHTKPKSKADDAFSVSSQNESTSVASRTDMIDGLRSNESILNFGFENELVTLVNGTIRDTEVNETDIRNLQGMANIWPLEIQLSPPLPDNTTRSLRLTKSLRLNTSLPNTQDSVIPLGQIESTSGLEPGHSFFPDNLTSDALISTHDYHFSPQEGADHHFEKVLQSRKSIGSQPTPEPNTGEPHDGPIDALSRWNLLSKVDANAESDIQSSSFDDSLLKGLMGRIMSLWDSFTRQTKPEEMGRDMTYEQHDQTEEPGTPSLPSFQLTPAQRMHRYMLEAYLQSMEKYIKQLETNVRREKTRTKTFMSETKPREAFTRPLETQQKQLGTLTQPLETHTLPQLMRTDFQETYIGAAANIEPPHLQQYPPHHSEGSFLQPPLQRPSQTHLLTQATSGALADGGHLGDIQTPPGGDSNHHQVGGGGDSRSFRAGDGDSRHHLVGGGGDNRHHQSGDGGNSKHQQAGGGRHSKHHRTVGEVSKHHQMGVEETRHYQTNVGSRIVDLRVVEDTIRDPKAYEIRTGDEKAAGERSGPPWNVDKRGSSQAHVAEGPDLQAVGNSRRAIQADLDFRGHPRASIGLLGDPFLVVDAPDLSRGPLTMPHRGALSRKLQAPQRGL
ncbi:uncharacterized protein [Panulirus ornatus]|uniref:uncharacterized protein n=1 Tax=Panulirus ornatus TaxID=150431 RepID=UPI003A8A961C